jgi:hypothetical protein
MGYFGLTEEELQTVNDPTDRLFGEKGEVGHYLSFTHIPTGVDVKFKAFLTTFEDRYISEWNSEDTFGRMDPIQTFKRTTRVIALAWAVPSFSAIEASKNLQKTETLLNMLYPFFEEFTLGGGSVATDSIKKNNVRAVGLMAAAPLFRLKFSNLIAAGNIASFEGQDAGLVGTISGLTYSPDLEQEFFGNEDGALIPQTINLSCDFTVLHTHGLGWKKKTGASGASGSSDQDDDRIEKRGLHFPYHGSNLILKKIT